MAGGDTGGSLTAGVRPRAASRGGIYVRLSRRTDGAKLGDQLAICRRLAEANGIEVVQEYEDDGISAFTGQKRPGWSELLRDVQAGRLDVLLAQSEDRFTRQVGEKETLTILCAQQGVTWLTVNDGTVDPSTADGEFFSIMRGGLARMESRRKVERQRQRNEARRQRGESPRGGHRPFGYGVVVGRKTVRRLDRETKEWLSVEVDDWDIDQLHPDEAPLIEVAYGRFVAREVTLSRIATEWNALGVKTVRGNPWDLPKVEKVLRRARNAGYVEHRLMDPETGRLAVWPSLVLGRDGHPVRGSWPAIIGEDTYAAAMARLTDPSRRLTKVLPPKHLCSSIAKCHCGTSLRVAGRNAGEVAYRCGVHDGAAHKTPGVRHVSVRCDELDALVVEEVISALLHLPKGAVPDPAADELTRLQVEMADTNRALGNLLDLVEGSGFDAAQIKAKSVQLNARAAAIESRIGSIVQSNAQADLLAHVQRRLIDSESLDAFGEPSDGARVSFRKAAEVKEQLREKYHALPLDQRRALVRGLVEVTVTTGRGPGRVKVWHRVATQLNPEEGETA